MRLSVLALVVAGLTAPQAASADSIAFVRDGSLWIANPDGTNARLIKPPATGGPSTNVAATEIDAAKGSGAPKLAYRSSLGIGVINADGTGRQAVPKSESFPAALASNVAIDPTGQKVAWVYTSSYICGIHLCNYWNGTTANLDGTDHTSVGRGSLYDIDFGNGPNQVIYSEQKFLGPDDTGCIGDRLYYYIAIQDNPPLFNSGGAETRRIVCRRPMGVDLSGAQMSPDGKWLAAITTTGVAQTTGPIFLIPADNSSNGTHLTATDFAGGEPEFSPDSKTIAFEGPDNTIWTVPVAGGQPTKILDNAKSPAWTPYSASVPGGSTGTGAGDGAGSGGGDGTGGGPGGGGQGGGGQPTAGGPLDAALPKAMGLAAFLKGFSVTGNGPGTLTTEVTAAGAPKTKLVASKKKAPKLVVATGKGTLTGPGVAKIKVKLTKKGKAALKGKKGKLKVTVTTTFKPAGGGAPVVTTDKVTLSLSK